MRNGTIRQVLFLLMLPILASCLPTGSIGGRVSGLTGTGLVLQNNSSDNLSIAAGSTSFTFATPVASGKTYAVTVLSQPKNQRCTVRNGVGVVAAKSDTVADINVVNVEVACVDVVASTSGFPVDVAMANLVKSGFDATIVVSGTVGSNPATGTGSYSWTPAIAEPFAGMPALDAAIVESYSLAANGTNATVPVVVHQYFSSDNYSPLGQVDAGNGQFQTMGSFAGWPKAARVGDHGQLGVTTIYNDYAKAMVVGYRQLFYTIEADTASTAILVLTNIESDVNHEVKRTTDDFFLLTTTGGISFISSRVSDAPGSLGRTDLWFTQTALQAPGKASVPSHWSLPMLVSNAIYSPSSWAEVTADAQGNAYCIPASMPQDVVTIFRKSVGMMWEAPFAVTPAKTPSLYSGYRYPQLRADSAGNLLTAWVDFDQSALSERDFVSQVYVRNFSQSSGWGASRVLQSNPSGYATVPRLAMLSNGMAWLVWTERTYKGSSSSEDRYALFAAKYTPGVGWSVPEKTTPDYSAPLGLPEGRIAVDQAGTPTVIWVATWLDGTFKTALYSTTRSGGLWSTPSTVVSAVFNAGGTITNHDLAVDGQGNAIAVWQRTDSSSGATLVYTNRYNRSTGWAGAEVMRSSALQTSANPALAMDAQGNAMLLWGEAWSLWSARYDAVRGWQPRVVVDQTSSAAAQLGFDAAGNATAVWPNVFAGSTVAAARYMPDAGWAAPYAISKGGSYSVRLLPRLAVSAGGRVTAVWIQDDVGNQSFKMWSSDLIP